MRKLSAEAQESGDSDPFTEQVVFYVIISIACGIVLGFGLLVWRWRCRQRKSKPVEAPVVRMVSVFENGVNSALPYPDEQDRPLPRRNLARLSGNSVPDRSMSLTNEAARSNSRRPQFHKMRLSRVMDLLLPDRRGSYGAWDVPDGPPVAAGDLAQDASLRIAGHSGEFRGSADLIFQEIFGAGNAASTNFSDLEAATETPHFQPVFWETQRSSVQPVPASGKMDTAASGGPADASDVLMSPVRPSPRMSAFAEEGGISPRYFASLSQEADPLPGPSIRKPSGAAPLSPDAAPAGSGAEFTPPIDHASAHRRTLSQPYTDAKPAQTPMTRAKSGHRRGRSCTESPLRMGSEAEAWASEMPPSMNPLFTNEMLSKAIDAQSRSGLVA